MSDEQAAVDTVAKVGLGALGGSPLLLLFVKRWFRRSDEEKQALLERIAKLEANQEKMLERMDKALAAQRADVALLADMATRADERMKIYARRVGEPVTNPGHKLSPEMLELVARYREEEPE